MFEQVSRYALPEYERRFLLPGIPGDVDLVRGITDRFIVGTRLRLRVVTDAATGEVLQRKVGHKVRPDADDPTVVMHTSLYLDPGELETLAQLPAVEVAKTRHRWNHDGHRAAVDAYSGRLAGLVIAELGFDDQASVAGYEPSPPLGPEVSRVTELTGPNLAGLTGDRLAELLELLG